MHRQAQDTSLLTNWRSLLPDPLEQDARSLKFLIPLTVATDKMPLSSTSTVATEKDFFRQVSIQSCSNSVPYYCPISTIHPLSHAHRAPLLGGVDSRSPHSCLPENSRSEGFMNCLKVMSVSAMSSVASSLCGPLDGINTASMYSFRWEIF
jgi:hypothetical protein